MTEGLLYKAWLANKDRLDLLFRIEREYSNWGPEYKSADDLARALFAKVTFLREYFLTGKKMQGFQRYRSILQYLYEDAFFTNKTELVMIAPDNKKSKISAEDLKSIIDRLPDISQLPEVERKYYQQMEEVFKKRKENGVGSTKSEPLDENSEAFKAGMKAAQKYLDSQKKEEQKSE